MGHRHLNYLKRCQILALWKVGFNQTQIATEVGVHKSTISREFNRNLTFVRTKLGYWAYKPDYAQNNADDRRKAISGYAKRWELFSISHERIYKFVLEDKQQGGELYTHLRHQNKRYRKRYGSPNRRCLIKNRTMIDERPDIVNEKCRQEDWEIDSIVGKNHKQAVLSVVERVSKFTLLKKLKTKTGDAVKLALTDALIGYKGSVYTITSDNGTEFARHEEISLALEADFFFAHPYSSWERGLNENTNGLVRQYLKKGSEFTDVTDETLAIIANKLNNRPRKSLDYQTPDEVFNG